MKKNQQMDADSSQLILGDKPAYLNHLADPAPLYRQEPPDAWDAILHAFLQLCLTFALLVCGLTLTGALNGAKPANVTMQASAAHIAVVGATANPVEKVELAAR